MSFSIDNSRTGARIINAQRLHIQKVNSPMYDAYMSTPGNTAKLGATHSNMQTAQRRPSLVGTETYNALVSAQLSQHSTHYASQA